MNRPRLAACWRVFNGDLVRFFLGASLLCGCGGATQFRATDAYRVAYTSAHQFCDVIVPALPAPTDAHDAGPAAPNETPIAEADAGVR